MNAKIKIGLVGISGYGESYVEALFRHPRGQDAEIVGVADPVPQRCRRIEEVRARGIPVHASMTDLLDRAEVDLMILSTPIHLHAPQTCQVLEAGGNVLCEKPLAGSLRDAVRMLQTQRTAKGFAAIGFQWSFVPAVQALKHDIMAGVLGRPVRLKTIVYFPRGDKYFSRNDWAGRITSPRGHEVLDSPVNNATAHYLHNMFYVLGPSRETSAVPRSLQAEVYRANDIENYDTAALRCRMDCGAEVLFYTTHATEQRVGPKSVFEFEDAVVEYDDLNGADFVATFRDGRVKHYGNPNADRNEKIWQCMDAVTTGAPVACGIRASIPHTLCVTALQEALSDIPTFPGGLKRVVPAGDAQMVVVDGLHETLVDCYEAGSLPAESGAVAWARPAVEVDLTRPQWSIDLELPTALHA